MILKPTVITHERKKIQIFCFVMIEKERIEKKKVKSDY